MKQQKLSTAGINPSISIDSSGIHVVWQNGSFIYRADVSPVTLAFSSTPIRVLQGGAAAYPEISGPFLAWRDGAEPYHGHLNEEDLGQAHGSRPFVFGEGKFAYIAGGANEGYPTKMRTLPNGAFSVVRAAQGTGLSRISAGKVVLIDEDRNAVPGINDPSFAGDAVVGTTDKNGAPTLLAFRGDKQCYIAVGEISNDPRMATDGQAFFVVAWSSRPNEGVRIWRVEPEDFVAKDNVPTPDDLPTTTDKKFDGFVYDHGKYGEWWPHTNSSWLGHGLYDGDPNIPNAERKRRIQAAAEKIDCIFASDDDLTFEYLRPYWKKVAAVLTHEPNTPEMAREWTAAARARMDRLKLPRKPVMVIITEEQSIDSRFDGTADIIGPEIYFRKPEASLEAQRQVVQRRLEAVNAAFKSPIVCFPQAYDRSNPTGWTLDLLHLLQFETLSYVITHPNWKGALGFAYGRPTGVITHPELEDWYATMMECIGGAPDIVNPPKPPDPVDPGENEMTADDLRRYIAELQNTTLFGAYQRFHNEVLPRDRPKDMVIKNADDQDMWTGDVTTGGANGIFNRVFIVEYCISRDKGRTAEQAAGDGYDAGKKSYDKAVSNPQ